MNANINEKRRQTKLLAAIAILAMVVCAFAVVMPSEQTDGALPETEASGALRAAGISASYEIGSAGNYYIANTTSTVAITFDADTTISDDVNLYIATGTTITVAAHSGFTVHVIPAVAATTTPAAGATVQIYKGLDIIADVTSPSTLETYSNTTNTNYVSINVSSDVITATYGISDVFTNGGSTYYAKGSSISVDVSAGRTVTVLNGTATVSYGANTVVLDGVMDASSGVVAEVEGNALQISGNASTTGKISVTAGQVATSNLSFALNNMEAVTTSTISTETANGVVLYAGIPQASEITSTLFIYKEVSAPISLTAGAQHTIYIRGNGDYSGTITQGSSSVEVEATQFSNNTNIVVTADNAFTLSGEVRSTTADNKTIVSDSSITVTDTNSDISVSNVALGTMTLINQVTVTSGSIVINDGAELTFAVSGDAQGKILLPSSTSLYIYGNVLRSEGVDNSTCVDVEDGASSVTIYGTNETLANAICGDIAAGNATFTLLSEVRYQASNIIEFRAALQSSHGLEVTGTIVLGSN